MKVQLSGYASRCVCGDLLGSTPKVSPAQEGGWRAEEEEKCPLQMGLEACLRFIALAGGLQKLTDSEPWTRPWVIPALWFKNENTEAWKSEMPCPMIQHKLVAGPWLVQGSIFPNLKCHLGTSNFPILGTGAAVGYSLIQGSGLLTKVSQTNSVTERNSHPWLFFSKWKEKINNPASKWLTISNTTV